MSSRSKSVLSGSIVSLSSPIDDPAASGTCKTSTACDDIENQVNSSEQSGGDEKWEDDPATLGIKRRTTFRRIVRYQKQPSISFSAVTKRLTRLTDQQRLATSKKAVDHAVWAMLFCVFVEAVNVMCVAPNQVLMVTPGAHPESFPNTDPFGIQPALYMINGAQAFAKVISSVCVGHLADKYSTRKILFVLMAGSVVGSLAAFRARRSYWAFVAVTFLRSLFSATITLATSYVGRLFKNDRARADEIFGFGVASMIVGKTTGGMLTVLFPANLFEPLFPAAGLVAVGMLIARRYVLDVERVPTAAQAESENDDDSPDKIHVPSMINIVVGAFLDNVGSLGIVPLAISALLYETYYLDFIETGATPIMSETQYRWLYSMIGLAAIPMALVSSKIFKRIGAALACVLANLITAVVITCLIFVSRSATKGSLVIFAICLYVGFGLAVLSMVSTSPMLDRIAPLEKKAFVQGFNTAIYDLANAVAPFCLSLISEKRGTALMMWVCVALSVLAGLTNMPLVFNHRLRDACREIKEDDDTAASFIDEAYIQERLNNAEHVPLREIYEVNRRRASRGEPLLQSVVGTYSREQACNVKSLSVDDLTYLRDVIEMRLCMLRDNSEEKEKYVQILNQSRSSGDDAQRRNKELGDWIICYLTDNGYFSGTENFQVFKAIFMRAFPQLSEGNTLTVDTVENHLLNLDRGLNNVIEQEQRPKWWRFASVKKGNKFKLY